MRFRLPIPLCLFNRHMPRRNRAKWDGMHFVGICSACGKPIRRRGKGRWEREWLEPAVRSEPDINAPG